MNNIPTIPEVGVGWNGVAAAVPFFLTSAVAACLGFLAPLRRRGSESAGVFQWVTLAIATWMLCFGVMILTADRSAALQWARVGTAALILIPAGLYQFTIVALGLKGKRRLALTVCWIISVGFAILAAGSNLLVSGLYAHWWGFYPRGGFATPILLVTLAGILMASIYEYWREYTDGSLWIQRTRMRAWLITFSIPLFAFVDASPAFGLPIYPLGFVFVLLFLLLAVYVFRKYWLVAITPSFAAREIVDTMADGVIVCDAAGRIQVVNHALLQLTGYTEEELTSQFLHLLLDPATTLADHSNLRRILSGETLPDRESIFRNRHGQPIDVSLSVARVGDTQTAAGAVVIVRDIGERKDAEDILRASEKRYRHLFERNLAGVFRTSVAGSVLDCNDACARIFGFASRADLIGRNAADFYESSHGRAEVLAKLRESRYVTGQELRLRKQDGSRVWVLENVTLVEAEDGDPEILEGTMVDITDLKVAQEKIEYQAYHDVLTDLPNRKLFIDRLAVALAQSRRSGKSLAVLFLDLDRFKMANDTLGHAGGDRLLLAVADRLLGSLRAGDTVARFGGDEFALLVSELRDPSDAAIVAGKILKSLEEPVLIDRRAAHLTGSLGVALFPIDGEDPETLLKNADSAMYRAKESGRNNFQLCTEEMKQRGVERLSLEQALRVAIQKNQLVLHYQPIIDLDRSRICAVEALVRWNHPERGLLSPDYFTAVAEDSNLIVPIGRWVMHTAFKQIKAWHKRGLEDIRLAVNLSARQFQQPDLLPMIEQLLAETGVDPKLIELEITESTAMLHASRTVRLLQELRQAGLTVAVDDFGIGYSSLNYLKRFPIDAVKIDKTFVHGLLTEPGDAAIIDAVLAIARTHKLRVIAEGVETEEQLTALVARGCPEAQGFLFSEALPGDELYPLIQSSRTATGSLRSPKLSAKAAKHIVN